MFLVHGDLQLRGSPECWQLDVQIAVFNFGREFIQWARRWAADVVAQDVEVTIVARADVMLNIGMPVNAATKVGTDVRKDSHFPLIFSHNIQTIYKP